VAKFLARLDVAPLILTSPLPRASQTAEIAGKQLKSNVRTEPSLRPGFDAKALKKILQNITGKNVMIVGHEPDFTHTIFQITGAKTKLSKAGVAMIDIEPDSMEGELRWLFPPKLAKT
jgi:phosphohistidine phosphatase SixA